MKERIYASVAGCGGIEVCKMCTTENYFLAREYASLIADDIHNGIHEQAPALVLSELRVLSSLFFVRAGTLVNNIIMLSYECDRLYYKEKRDIPWNFIYGYMVEFLDTNYYGKDCAFEY